MDFDDSRRVHEAPAGYAEPADADAGVRVGRTRVARLIRDTEAGAVATGGRRGKERPPHRGPPG
jgi:hypothetical protein